MLTQKQEAFVIKYLECGNATEAYKHAYNTGKMSNKDIGNEAYDLTLHPEIAPKIKQYRQAIESKALENLVIDKEYITKRILYNIEIAECKIDPAVALKGLDMLGKMYDLNEDKQNDRLFTGAERLALVENYKKRLLDVTPE